MKIRIQPCIRTDVQYLVANNSEPTFVGSLLSQLIRVKTALQQIPVILCTTPSLAAVTGFVAMISTSYIILAAPIFFRCVMWHCILIHLCGFHHQLHFLQLCGQLLLSVLHRVGHMIHRRLHDRRSLHLRLVFVQGFVYPCNDIAHHVGMMHTHVFNGEIVRLSQLSARCPKNCLNFTHVFCISGIQFHLRITSLNLPVLCSMTYTVLTACICV